MLQGIVYLNMKHEELDEESLDEIRSSRIWLRLIRNKYLLVTAFFIVWMAFFDNNNWMYLERLTSEANQKKADRAWYKREIEQVKKEYQELTSSIQAMEKYGREKYFMKRADEDVYVFFEGEVTP
ncbi:MAG: septum formation initiator family protein [Flavobacteriales bacterium]|nr:septum formation initiator family protein [Flavobacteriales bacterium]